MEYMVSMQVLSEKVSLGVLYDYEDYDLINLSVKGG